MLDKVIVAIAMISLIIFVGIVVGYVAEPDLVIVVALMVALAMHDFWISVFSPKAATGAKENLPLEALPSGVSGKPLPPKSASKKKSTRSKSASKRKTASRRAKK